ncbi:zgc:55448, related [Neospora caninum Liverpool]|uniref:Zgc:55448, related n=1 Tax=Neospora caninum (strain Liverpool) TaxID=572307 RepID=F0VCE6_NEOCL|nr:zgc:55448, related [Neospora caninum Liverpool]CBZ51268.1 zgc:55448, related [Neospora caninum Liverpool]CEL68583.1 TPA: Zgc:55448, related [Neospora caninum Liverpool]|eukprot:XP_003881301.1 zgc:55448, related [Neospora caninum Liverpool]
MGGDGGSVPTRADMVKTKGYKFLRNLGGMGYVPNTQVRESDERFGRNESRDLQLSTCALSQEPLRPPIVTCRLGRLYNKEAVLTKLVQKALPPHMKHITSMKDIKQCKAEINEATNFLVCPISRVDIRSGIKASIIWPCGCVISAKALNAAAAVEAPASQASCSISSGSHKASRTTPEMAASEVNSGKEKASGEACAGRRLCLICGHPYDPIEDLIPLLPTEEEQEKLKVRLEKLAQDKAAQKKAKKQRELAESAAGRVGSSNSKVSTADISKPAVHSIIVAPCATSTKLRADAFHVTTSADTNEKKNKRGRDWVISGSASVDDLLGNVKVPRKGETTSGRAPAAVV